jgi:hypothetical protein
MAQGRRGRRTAGSIRRLPSGRFQARVRCDDGTMQPAPFTFSTKTEADRWLASAITDQAQGSWVDPRAGKVLFRDFAREWLHAKADLAPKTVEGYTYLIDHLLLPTLGDVELADLRPARVRAWRASLLRARRPGPTTIASGASLRRLAGEPHAARDRSSAASTVLRGGRVTAIYDPRVRSREAGIDLGVRMVGVGGASRTRSTPPMLRTTLHLAA